MRDPERIPQVLGAIRVAWLAYPDERLGQLLKNALSFAGVNPDFAYQVEEDVWRDALYSYAARKPPRAR